MAFYSLCKQTSIAPPVETASSFVPRRLFLVGKIPGAELTSLSLPSTARFALWGGQRPALLCGAVVTHCGERWVQQRVPLSRVTQANPIVELPVPPELLCTDTPCTRGCCTLCSTTNKWQWLGILKRMIDANCSPASVSRRPNTRRFPWVCKKLPLEPEQPVGGGPAPRSDPGYGPWLRGPAPQNHTVTKHFMLTLRW